MTFVRYFRIALVLPLVGGGLSVFMSPLAFLALGLLLYGPRYAVFAVVVLLWSRTRTERTVKIATLWLPVLFLPFMLISLPESHGPHPSFELHRFLSQLAVDGGVTLMVGYFYVLLGWLFYAIGAVWRHAFSKKRVALAGGERDAA